MVLVGYASSSDEEKEEIDTDRPPASSSSRDDLSTIPLKRKQNESQSHLPPLPSKFHDLYASAAKLSQKDDPSLHGGRKRQIPHVVGNWPTHIYIEYYNRTDEQPFQLHSLLTSDLGVPLPLHISLSRSIHITTDQRSPFFDSLKRLLNSSGIRPFQGKFTLLEWVANSDATRWFLVLRVLEPEHNQLNKLLHISNMVVQDYGNPCLYTASSVACDDGTFNKSRALKDTDSFNPMNRTKVQNASAAFHVSVAWALQAPSEGLVNFTKQISPDFISTLTDVIIPCHNIKVKTGNIVQTISLKLGYNRENVQSGN
ncbi:hypothetical protein BGHDH14_bgh00376 [Blumeria hordei DH14]|uniref:U6 snRNA phosphodiesterase n=1 Tax=Blumeria graminis f. sp. hordei (strain DH14) TaxID=546991 RepID=N1JEY5_BLUG1|nr:hypothetical protein BGHDH14_bgh00376 [Blumeria hordei DH14]